MTQPQPVDEPLTRGEYLRQLKAILDNKSLSDEEKLVHASQLTVRQQDHHKGHGMGWKPPEDMRSLDTQLRQDLGLQEWQIRDLMPLFQDHSAKQVAIESIKSRLVELDLLEQAINQGRNISGHKILRLKALLSGLASLTHTEEKPE